MSRPPLTSEPMIYILIRTRSLPTCLSTPAGTLSSNRHSLLQCSTPSLARRRNSTSLVTRQSTTHTATATSPFPAPLNYPFSPHSKSHRAYGLIGKSSEMMSRRMSSLQRKEAERNAHLRPRVKIPPKSHRRYLLLGLSFLTFLFAGRDQPHRLTRSLGS